MENLTNIIDTKLRLEYDTSQNRQRSGKWSPSAFGRCLRYQVWNRMNEKPTNPPDDRSLRIFKVGKIFHDFIEKQLPNHWTEVEINNGDVFGYADVVGDDYVTDIKSVHSRSFWWMGKSGYDITKEKYSNILQVMTYAFFLEKPKGTLIFISRDDLCTESYTFFLNKWEDKVKEELEKLRYYWNRSLVPKGKPRAYGVSKKTGLANECGYCSYRDKCKGEK